MRDWKKFSHPQNYLSLEHKPPTLQGAAVEGRGNKKCKIIHSLLYFKSKVNDA